MKKTNLKPLAAAMGTAFAVAAFVPASTAATTDNPFAMQELTAGYDLANKGDAEGKCGEGKCGEGKCGEAEGDTKGDAEGKCGEGKCGEAEGDTKADAEGKCGEGKCGEGKCGS